MIMSEQPPPDDDSHGSHSRPGEAGDGPVGSTQSDIVAPKAPEYSVGYGRAPLHSRFKPGRSGNAKGRPKDNRNVKTELKKVYTDKIVMHEGGKKRHVTRITALLLRQWERGIKGDERATRAAIATAKSLGVFDGAETEECRPCILSEDILDGLSDQALEELVRLEEIKFNRTKH
jgi:hypothetical protein